MAGRKVKQTVDYFPHYCNHKKTMYIIERQFGNDGYALWFKTLELLGKTEGHYYDCNELDNWEFYLSYCGINAISAEEILNKLSQLGGIDPKLWEKKVIWSDKFVENITDAYRKRKTLPPSKPISTGTNDNSTAGNSKDSGENTQSKVEYSRVKESIVEKWNSFASEFDLAKVMKVTDTRSSHIINRIEEEEFDFDSILEKIKKSNFLKGENNRGWKVDFDFIFASKNNYIKILEGKYEGRTNNGFEFGHGNNGNDTEREYTTFG